MGLGWRFGFGFGFGLVGLGLGLVWDWFGLVWVGLVAHKVHVPNTLGVWFQKAYLHYFLGPEPTKNIGYLDPLGLGLGLDWFGLVRFTCGLIWFIWFGLAWYGVVMLWSVIGIWRFRARHLGFGSCCGL